MATTKKTTQVKKKKPNERKLARLREKRQDLVDQGRLQEAIKVAIQIDKERGLY